MQGVKDYVEECFEEFKNAALKEIKYETEIEIEKYKVLKNDMDRVSSLRSLLEEALNIFLRDKEAFEAKLISAINGEMLSSFSGYNNLLKEAIDCLLKKEGLENSLDDLDKQIAINEKDISDLNEYYERKIKKKA